MRPLLSLLPAVLLPIALSACSGGEDSQPKPEIVRPVLSIVIKPQTADAAGFAGTVDSRYSADLSFRLLGRVTSRSVDAGDPVKKGEVIATLDQTALALSVQSAKADYASAQAQLVNASANDARLKKLLSGATIAKAQYEAAHEANLSAKANADRAKAALDKAQEQLSYTSLSSDFDGVVTSIGADVGQTVSPGQTVLSVARPDAREAVVDIPDYLIGGFHPGDRFDVSLQSLPAVKAVGTLREIAPQSDAATRTRRVRLTLADPPRAFRLGSTITANPETAGRPFVALPLSALLEKDGLTQVWTVDPASATVRLKTVKVLRKDAGSFVVESGLAEGDRVVVAGVHSLRDGQKVKLEGADS